MWRVVPSTYKMNKGTLDAIVDRSGSPQNTAMTERHHVGSQVRKGHQRKPKCESAAPTLWRTPPGRVPFLLPGVGDDGKELWFAPMTAGAAARERHQTGATDATGEA